MKLNYGNDIGERPHTPMQLIEYFERVAVECLDKPEKQRLMGIALSVVETIERLQSEKDAIVSCVELKWEGETREQTAKRYIIERESACREAHAAQWEPSFHGRSTEGV